MSNQNALRNKTVSEIGEENKKQVVEAPKKINFHEYSTCFDHILAPGTHHTNTYGTIFPRESSDSIRMDFLGCSLCAIVCGPGIWLRMGRKAPLLEFFTNTRDLARNRNFAHRSNSAEFYWLAVKHHPIDSSLWWASCITFFSGWPVLTLPPTAEWIQIQWMKPESLDPAKICLTWCFVWHFAWTHRFQTNPSSLLF